MTQFKIHFKVWTSALLCAGLILSTAAEAQWGGGGKGPGGWNDDWREDDWGREKTETYKLELRGQVFNGMGKTYRLRQSLKAAYPRLDLTDATIKTVTVNGKSRHGNGSVELQIANRSSDRKNLPNSSRYSFESNDRRSYTRVDLRAYGRQDNNSTWILVFDGQIKVNTIEIEVTTRTKTPTKPPMPPAPTKPTIQSIVIGQAGTQPILPITQAFPVYERGNAKSLRLEGMGNLIQIVDVVVEYSSGRRISLSQLQTQLFPGQHIEVALAGNEAVRQVWVTAATLVPFGNPGQYKVSMSVERR